MPASLRWLTLVGAFLTACSGANQSPPKPVTATEHDAWFPIGAGAVHALDTPTADGPIACESCHRSSAVQDITCLGCHRHPTDAVEGRDINASLHLGAPDYQAKVNADAGVTEQSQGCLSCHPAGKRLFDPFPHQGIPTGTGTWCRVCHDVDRAFAALPVAGFTHQDVGTTDCGACHVITTWKGASSVPATAFDPTSDVQIDALLPAWSGPVIVSVAPDPQTLHMTMNHATRALDAGVLTNCGLCHAQASLGAYAPGVMHWSLTTIGAAQPRVCGDCHASTPEGFVGDLDPNRSPSSGPMRHDAVAWAGGVPTTNKLLTMDCSTCHRAPDDQVPATWKFANGRDDAGAQFHASLGAASLSQPASCIDCHANTRPTGTVNTSTFSFDHSNVLGDCAGCHQSTASWSGAKFHATGSTAPTTCLPCHATERPTATTGWQTSFSQSPFDYVTNSAGITHGDGLDCAQCHAGPGTGQWGVNQNWKSGHFDHAPGSVADTTCLVCHTTQRPDRLTPAVNPGFDHAANGASDCVGCHQASLSRGSFVNLLPIPGGDWRGGTTYPGANPVTSATQFIKIPSTTLTKTGTKVTGMTTATVTLPNAFLHTSSAIPSAISPGPAGSPNQNSCWHCHTSTGTSVTAYADGRFHASLTSFKTSPTASVTPLPQPTACLDCHKSMRPPAIVSRLDGGTWVKPMDHASSFTGGSVAGVPNLDCATCHHTPGLGPTQWSDGTFHPNTPSGASPSDCVGCHWPVVTTPAADVTSPWPNAFTMKHRSSLVTTQACGTCHQGALQRSTAASVTTSLWRPGAYHAGASPQPASCLDCHSGSAPNVATQSTVSYALAQGGTSTNQGQWMNHADPATAGKDCAVCHAGDAKASGSAWSRSTGYHAHAAAPGACSKCHGLTNGKGTTVGTNNNLPAGLTDSDTVTTSSASPGTHDQLSHADVNVSATDCGKCHTQVGPSTAAGVQGHEWAQAAFHKNVSGSLVLNGTTGRCSNCHLNVKPGSSYAAFNHSAISGTGQDCSACHSFPGTSATTPNWKGASGAAHATSGSTASSSLDCGTCHGPSGSSSQHLGTPISSHYGGTSNGNRCTSCHLDFTAFKGTTAVMKYGHTNATANSSGCKTCHFYMAQVYTTLTTTPSLSHPLNGNAHQFSQTYTVTGSHNGESFSDPHTASPMGNCGACHQYSSTTASTNIWTFLHRPNNPGIFSSKSSNGCNECH